MKKYDRLYYYFHNQLDILEILDVILNRLVVRIKRPVIKGDVLIIEYKKEKIYAEVIEQRGCVVILWIV